MASPSTQFATSRRMGIYDPLHQISMWQDTFEGDISPNIGVSSIVQVDTRLLDNKIEYTSHESLGPPVDNQAAKNSDKSQRRLAQNREAARKSRMRKKAYVQQLETSRLKLAQMEQELLRARQQGLYTGNALDMGNVGFSGTVNSEPGCISLGIPAFEMEYGHWVEEQQRKNAELRNVLQTHISDIELRIFVDNGLNHYYDLFRMKLDAAKADIFYLMSGMWRTSVERFFLWIGGFRPSELLNVLIPQLEPLTDQQVVEVCSLRHSCQQAEDALSQGMDKLQQTLAQTMIVFSPGAEAYHSQMSSAMERLDALENFVNQADHLRQQTLRQMSNILTTRQAARGLLALGEYLQRLRALSTIWAARPREPA
ncbi:hypothetical protein RJ639_037689 [Escallonia herrerae]|uniref:Uncharacterized protein n=1 Tax=Escallonia herrerae TaxID=1293975 RepID=A0AA89B5Q6_9ASTE|nr:hypothetical protein RJ639_037689 [Escallonia herrerae]